MQILSFDKTGFINTPINEWFVLVNRSKLNRIRIGYSDVVIDEDGAVLWDRRVEPALCVSQLYTRQASSKILVIKCDGTIEIYDTEK